VRIRKASILAALVIANFATASMGLPIGNPDGKFSGSNIAPVVFVCVAGLFFLGQHRAINRRFLWLMLVFNASCMLSFAIFLVGYRWEPNVIVLFFEDAQVLFCVLLWWFARENPAEFSIAVKRGILCFIPVAALYTWLELHKGAGWLSFGMDDKSQSAVLLCCAAYIFIRCFGGKRDRVIGTGLFVASFLTVSRLPVFFMPAILFGLMRRSRVAAVVSLAAACAGAYVLATAGNAVGNVFAVYDRLSSVQTISQEDSTTAHLLLLKTAMRIKFSDPLAFVFGIGPSNFSKALTSFQVSFDQLERVDPTFVDFARRGKAPLHSLPLQVLLDYNIAWFVVFVFALARGVRFLLQRHVLSDTLFFFGFFAASMFYSLHNKPYFYLYATTVAFFVSREARSVARERTHVVIADALQPEG